MPNKALIIIGIGVALIFVILAVCTGIFFLDMPSQKSCTDGSSCLQMQECYDLHTENNLLQDIVLLSCRDRTDRVCCAVQESPAVNAEGNLTLLPTDSCGLIFVPTRITLGQEAGLGQFPWMALIGYRPDGSNGALKHLCGGTLINERYVLTAAHCMADGFPVSVRLGEHDLSQIKDCGDISCSEPPVDIEVEKVITHKQFNKPYLKNDIALIRLKTKANMTDYIHTVCLPFGVNVTGEEDSVKYTVAGWGKVDSGNVNGSDTLQFTTVPSVPVSECNYVDFINGIKPIGELQLCAGGQGGHDACKGDSGGPLLHYMTDKSGDSRAFQLGIVSFGYVECGKELIPSVYTRVTAYLPWILSHLEP